ncbi:MAG: hypothetical protein K6T63_13070 [Alicyclobacillus herbarius]|uniref:hypothetical protein n=1 Tax=Alicyclobacillus herbarius TaxID=122960 RepID=UPI00235710D2|nr:hypothetical protein [Alicyclobacillus herbarius]MCL6633548.1 hypothetical protein [Alicyclobacillus herbarius]
MRKETKIAALAGMAVLLLGGGTVLGFTASGSHKPAPAPPQMKAQPTSSASSTSKSPKPWPLKKRERILKSGSAKKYYAVPVRDLNGKSLTLSVKDHPIVFVSDWDTDILSQLSAQHNYANPPDVVVTWPQKGESLQTAGQKVQQVMKKLGLTEPVYTLVSSQTRQPANQWITGVPDTYVLNSKGQVVEIPGPLPQNQVKDWSQVFSKDWRG